jgi:hypothetical protein
MGLFKTAAKVAVASSVHGRIQRRQQQRWAAQDAAAAAPVAPPAPVHHAPPPAASGPDMATKLAQLAQLGELKNAGVLTDAEFEAQKAAILAQ